MNTVNELIPPNGFYSQLREWTKDYQEFYSDETILFPKPKGIDPPRWNLEANLWKPFVATIPNGRIWSNSYIGEVITPNNKTIRDVGFPGWWKDFSNDEEMPPLHYFGGTLAALSCGTVDNYFHWFLDILPRIDLLNKSGIPIDKYFIGKLVNPYQFESLAELGINKEKLVQAESPVFHLKAKNLVVASLPLYTGPCPKWACDFIRCNFINMRNVKPIEGLERIYISREDSAYRKVLNEKQVMEVLAAKGFKKILLRPLSLHAKISIFSSAKAIVSPVDAGLANLVFCDPGIKIIQFSPETLFCDVYWKISHHVHLDYYHMECGIENPPKESQLFDNIIVDIDKLSKTLEMAGI